MSRSNATGSKLMQISCSRARTASQGTRVGGQPLVRRRRRTVRFPDACAIALFSDQLERRLEEVHEQAH
jgi:hypothetical protein